MNTIEILDNFNIQLEGQRLRKNGEEIAGFCPFHDGHGLRAESALLLPDEDSEEFDNLAE